MERATRLSCLVALNESPVFASKNFILFAKDLRSLLPRARTQESAYALGVLVISSPFNFNL